MLYLCSMVHSSSLTAFIATLSLCSLAHAQEPTTGEGSTVTAEQPPLDAPSQPPVANQPSTMPAPATPAAPAVLPAAPPMRLAPPSDHHPYRPHGRVHEGFYLRLGSGPSFTTLRGHGPSGSASITDSGTSGFIAIGGALAPGLVLAGTLQGTAFNADFKGGPLTDATVRSNGQTRSASRKADGGFGMLGILVDWYPRPAGGWHTGFATGVGAVGLTNTADDSDLGGLNFAGSVFGGYDWALGRKWALGLQLTASGATRTKLKDDFDSHDSRDSGYRLTPLSVGVQASLLYF